MQVVDSNTCSDNILYYISIALKQRFEAKLFLFIAASYFEGRAAGISKTWRKLNIVKSLLYF